jgi:nitrate reductase gamma subunit
MKYIISVLIVVPSIYTFSYAKYCWSGNAKLAALGSILLAIISIALSIALVFLK